MKNLISTLAAILASGLAANAAAPLDVTAATGGLNIPGSTAADGSSPAWTTLGSIILEEHTGGGHNGDFEVISGGTLIFKAPAGFEFNTGSSPSVSTVGGDLNTLSASVTDSSTLTVTLTVSTTTHHDSLTISGIQVRPTVAAASASGNIYRPSVGGGTAVVDGITKSANGNGSGGSNLGSLSEVPQSVSSGLVIQTQPSTPNTAGVVFGTQPVIRVVDQNGNTMTTDSTTSVTAAVLSGSGTLQGTLTKQAVNGIVTFTDLSHNVAGTITIQFTSGSLTNKTSQNVVINPTDASQLVWSTQPGNATVGSPFGNQPVLVAKDVYGNNSTVGFGASQLVSVSANTGTLQGTTLVDIGTSSANPGSFAFSNLRLDVVGTAHLTASTTTSGGTQDAISDDFTVAQGSQTISFAPLSDKTFGDAPFIVSATASSGLPVTFAVSGPATIDTNNNTITITGAGTVTVTASQVGNPNWAAAEDVQRQFNVAKANQTIDFAGLSSKTFGDAAFTVSATASSGLPVSFAVSGPATIDTNSNTITITGAGTVTVTASQGGNDNYNAAESVQQQFNVAKANQTIDFAGLSNKTFGDAAFTVSATASSGLPVSFAVSGPATIDTNSNTITITGTGTVTVTASQGGNDNYNAAEDVQQQFNVGKANQTIDFAGLSNKTFGDAAFTVSATASSGLAVSFAVSGPATIDTNSNTITITGAGTVTVTASQGGNDNYNAAENVQQQFNVGKANQTIDFAGLSNKTFGDAAFTVSATASSGLPVSFAVSGPATIDTNSNTITLTGTGTVTVTASQAGDDNYNAAENVQQQFNVAALGQTITFDSLTNKVFGDAPFAISATASSGLPVSFDVSGPASFDGTNITILGSGTVTVTASQAGNENYGAAQNVVQQFEVAKADQTITFGALADKGNNDAPFPIFASSTSGLEVQFGITGPATISSNVVTITGTGLVTITASQPGDTNYNAAEDVVRSFNVTNSVTAPGIDAQPSDLSVVTGFPATFGVGVFGSEPLTFQWMFNGTNIDSATNATFTIPFVKLSDAGAYSVLVGNPGGNILSSNATLTVLRITNDMNLDGRADLLLQNTNDNTIALWNLEGTNFYSSVLLNNGEPLTAGWRLAAQADFDHDGNTDLVLQNGGFVTIWYMNGTNLDHSVAINSKAIPASWKVIACADFNHDGSIDILFQKDSGFQAVWYMNGNSIIRARMFRGGKQVPVTWRLVGADDFNQDGHVDLLWQNAKGRIAVWGLDGIILKSVNLIPGGLLPAQGWRIAGLVDLNGDGIRDIVWQNSKDGRLFVWFIDHLNKIDSNYLIGGESLPEGWTVVGER